MKKYNLTLIGCLVLFFVFLILGHIFNPRLNTGKYSNYASKPCIRIYPADDKKVWETICAKSPFIDNTIIEEDLSILLQKVGFLCSGFLYPRAGEINLVCEDIK